MPKREAPESKRLSPEKTPQQRRYQPSGASSSSIPHSEGTICWKTQFHTHFPLWFSSSSEGDAPYWEDIYKGSVRRLSMLMNNQRIRNEWKMLFNTGNRVLAAEFGASQTALLCEALISGINLLGGTRFREACNLATFLHYRLPQTLADALYKSALSGAYNAQSRLFWAILCRQPLTDELFTCVNDFSDLPALHFATLLDNRALIEQLLDKGADIHIKNREGENAVLIAAKTGNIGVLDFLVSADASSIDEPNHSGNTPLHAAADAGHIEVLSYLVTHGADINKRNHEGATPLLTVCEGESDFSIAKFLVDNGADIEIADESGFTPFLTAVWADKDDIVRYLLNNGASPHVTEVTGRGALHFAAENNNVELIKRIAEHCTNLDSTDNSELTPLHVAAWNRCTESTEILLERGANPACISINGSTPLHLAAMQNAVDIIKCLVKYNIDINEGWRTGRTALASAVLAGNVDTVLYLLKKGALVNVPGQTAFSLLQSAVHHNHNDVIRALFLSDTLSESDTLNFVEYAASSGYTDIVDICFQSGFYLPHLEVPPVLRNELRQRSLANTAMRQHSLLGQITFELEKKLTVPPRTLRLLEPLKVMPIGYGPDGKNYLKSAMDGCTSTLLWINAYDQRIPGSVVSWLKQTGDTVESFCIAVNLTGLRHRCFLPFSAKQLKTLYRATPDSLSELRDLHEYGVLQRWLTTLANAEEMRHFHDRCQRLSHYLHIGHAAETPAVALVPRERGQRRITEFFLPRAPEAGLPELEQQTPIIRPS